MQTVDVRSNYGNQTETKPRFTDGYQRGLSRLGGAESQGSTPLADDIGSRQAAKENKELASDAPDPMKLTLGRGRQYSDLDLTHPGHGNANMSQAFTADAEGAGSQGILRGSVAGGLKSRQWKGRA